MSGCSSSSCTCGDCQCGPNCKCRTMADPTYGGLRNYNEPDCKCGLNCQCADCNCHR